MAILCDLDVIAFMHYTESITLLLDTHMAYSLITRLVIYEAHQLLVLAKSLSDI